MTQTEAELEQKLIDRLTGLGYEPVILRNAEDFKANLKTQLEKHNHIKLSDTEFNYFSPNCVDTTDNTRQLVEQMAGDNPLIVTTIQKLNRAIKSQRHELAIERLKDKRIVFIFDECHRSQFGETHKNIVKFFT